MQFVGDHLKKARKSRKINIKYISDELNISQQIIEKIENNDFYFDINRTYLIGYLRAYANLLELDADEVIKHFKSHDLDTKDYPLDVIPKPLERDNFFLKTKIKSVSFFSIIVISFTFYFLFIRSNDLQPNYSMIPDMPENFQAELETTEMNQGLNKIDQENSTIDYDQAMVVDSENNISTNNFSSNESSAIASLSSASGTNKLSDKITLKFLDATWIYLQDQNEQTVTSKLMNKEDEYSYFITDEYLLTSGNAGNILIIINGETRGKAGKRGEVIDSLIIHSDFGN